jgi:HAD superfamily hydrolase (TIGR01549 family)
VTVLSPEIDTVIFDLDGTLRLNRPDAQVFFLDYAVGLGAPGDIDTIRQARQWAHRYWASSECLANDIKTFGHEDDMFWVNYARQQLEAMNLEDGQAEAWAPQLHTYMEEHYDWEDTIPDDVVPTLQSLKAGGYQVGLLTNRTNPVDEYLAETGLDQHLDFWVYSGMVDVWKPSPEIFYYTLEVAGSAPSKTIYIGDNYYADVEGAQGANIQPVLIDPDDVFPEADCPVIRAIGELPEMLGVDFGSPS